MGWLTVDIQGGFMDYKIGEKVIYPNQGVGVIEEICTKNIAGQNEEFYMLRIVSNNSTVMIPTSNLENVGIRKLCGQKEVKSLLKILRDELNEHNPDWKNRYKGNVERMNSGSIFEELKQGLQAPIEDMGTAFSSSLFGLAGSLILGFLDLQANQAQNRFYNDLEEWLSTVTRLSSGSIGVEGEQSIPAYVQALLEQTAESLENLQRTLSRGEESKISLGSHLQSVSGKLETLTDHMRTQQALMQSLAEHQIEIKPILAQLANNGSNDTGLDDTTRMHIRNLDVYVGRITEEMKSGRDEMSKQIRSELKLLARLIASQKNDIESQS